MDLVCLMLLLEDLDPCGPWNMVSVLDKLAFSFQKHLKVEQALLLVRRAGAVPGLGHVVLVAHAQAREPAPANQEAPEQRPILTVTNPLPLLWLRILFCESARISRQPGFSRTPFLGSLP